MKKIIEIVAGDNQEAFNSNMQEVIDKTTVHPQSGPRVTVINSGRVGAAATGGFWALVVYYPKTS